MKSALLSSPLLRLLVNSSSSARTTEAYMLLRTEKRSKTSSPPSQFTFQLRFSGFSSSMSAIAALPTDKQKKHHATEAGNYFVSNYPPYAFWQKEQIFAVDKVLDEPAPN